MSRVNTKFDIRGLVLENTSLVHMELAVSHTKKIKEKRGHSATVRGREAAGKSQTGSLGAPSNTGRQTNWSLGATPSGIVSLCESSEKRIIEFIIGGEVLKEVALLLHCASDWCVGLVDVDLAGGITIWSCLASPRRRCSLGLAEGDPAWGELGGGRSCLGRA